MCACVSLLLHKEGLRELATTRQGSDSHKSSDKKKIKRAKLSSSSSSSYCRWRRGRSLHDRLSLVKRENLEPSGGPCPGLYRAQRDVCFFFTPPLPTRFPLSRERIKAPPTFTGSPTRRFEKKKKGEGVRNCSFEPVSGGVLTGADGVCWQINSSR